MNPLTPGQLEQIDDAIRASRNVEAIRFYREATGSPLSSAIAFIEARSNQVGLPEEPLPSALQAFLSGTHGRKGELAGWWRNPSHEICVLVLFQEHPTAQFELNVFPESIGSWAYDLNGYTLTLRDLQEALKPGRTLEGAGWGQDTRIVQKLSAFAAAIVRRLEPPPLPNSTTLFLLDRSRFETDYLFLPTTLPRALWEELTRRSGEESDSSQFRIQDEFANLSLSTGTTIWACCRKDCGSRQETSQSSPTFFSDIEARPPAWKRLSYAAIPAWETFVGFGGVSGQPHLSLPWWLEGARQAAESHAGLLFPSQARLIARHATELGNLFSAGPWKDDANRFLALIADAGGADAFCLSWECGD